MLGKLWVVGVTTLCIPGVCLVDCNASPCVLLEMLTSATNCLANWFNVCPGIFDYGFQANSSVCFAAIAISGIIDIITCKHYILYIDMNINLHRQTGNMPQCNAHVKFAASLYRRVLVREC